MKKTNNKIKALITVLMILVFGIGFFVFYNKPQIASAGWWNDSWSFRQSIPVTNNTSQQTNVYITLTIDTSDTDKFQDDCGDIRFTKINGQVLEYYIASGCGTATSSIHVNFDTLEAGAQNIYMYYGNPDADNGFSLTDFATATSNFSLGTFGQEEKGPDSVLYLSFDEGYGTIAHDGTSNNNDGTITGATWKDESNCKSGKCLEFDGSGDYIEIANSSSLSLSNEFTLEAWIRPQDTVLSSQSILAKTESPTDPTKIYRSVGPSATSAITTGASNAMTITGDRATFASALPTNVGVGDAIQYDVDGDSDIDASDKIVFIHERISSKEYIVKTNSGGLPSSVKEDEDWSLFRAYTSLANAEKGVENTGIDSDLRNFDDWTAGGDATTDDVGKDLVAANQEWNIACYANGTTVDATTVTINGWTTAKNNYINIYTPVNANEVGVSQRHVGKWDNNKYKLETNSDASSIGVAFTQYLVIDGLQVKNNFNNRAAIGTGYIGGIVILKNSVIQGNGQASSGIKGVYFDSTVSSERYVYNNIVYNLGTVNTICFAAVGNGNHYYYNNTCYGANEGFSVSSGASIVHFKNNITQNNVTGYSNVSYIDVSINNLSGDATATGTDARINQTVSFLSTTGGSEDLHLSPTDTAAKNAGADLSGDDVFPFATDIDGQSRLSDGAFDIGADEAQATQIYRSVSPGKTEALETGAGNSLSIIGNVATFQHALADNIGVGDVIQYDDDNDGDIDASDSLAFITGRISSFEYRVSNAAGGTPTEVISDNDWSIYRAYTSLYNAEEGTENTGIDSDLRNFDTWSGGKDLVTSKEQWNIACYGNGTTTDTVAVTVNGWTVGVQNFVKIYTPVGESEVGESQRHEGVWDDGKYRLETGTGSDSLYLYGNNTIIDGLQIYSSSTTSDDSCIDTYGYRKDMTIKNNILKGGYNGFYHINANELNSGYRIYNNIVYNSYQAGIFFYNNTSVSSYVYNNTVYNCNIGNFSDRGGIIVSDADNIVVNNISINNGIADINGGTQSYNISSDASAAGTGSLTNQTLGDIDFVSTTSGSEDLHILGTSVARNAGTDLSQIATSSFAVDIDGDIRLSSSTTWDIGADEAAATKIYRSVGPGNTSALATDENHIHAVTVSAGVATFSSSLPDRIGVGDAVLIDTNTDNNITSADTILFIHGRTSSKVYTVRTHAGAMPADIAVNDTYKIYRAYTGLWSAENGTKNTSIPISFNGGNRNLVANNEVWKIACYGDAVNTGVNLIIDDWTMSTENYLEIYTPVNADEVGISQRHSGKWREGAYTFYSTHTELYTASINVYDDFVKIIGIQFFVETYNANSTISVGYLGASNKIEITNNIIKKSTKSDDSMGIIVPTFGQPQNVLINNNIIEGFRRSDGYGDGFKSDSTGAIIYLYNNTFYNCGRGVNNTNGTVYAKNNIAQNCDNGFSGSFTSDSDYNISDLASDAPGTHSKNSTTVTFRDAANKDYRLAMTDTAAKGAGINLSYDSDFPITTDIEGEIRPLLNTKYQILNTSFDIGADQISGIEHNNYTLKLHKDYPQASLSTSNSDQESFSTGDTVIPANTWSHIVYKRDSDTEELYVNGFRKDSQAISNFAIANNGKLYIGAKNSSSTESFKGLLDEVRIYSYPRTATQIKADYSSGLAGISSSQGIAVSFGAKSSSWLNDGLVGYWKLDESATTSGAIDSSGNGNTGTYTGNASTTGGKFGNGGVFDGSGDYVDTGDINVLEGISEITISAWVKNNKSELSITEFIVQKSGPSTDSFLLDWSSGEDVQFFVYTSDGNAYGSFQDGIPTGSGNAWHHVVGVYDGKSVSVYVDGVRGETNPALSGNILNTGHFMEIGGHGDFGAEWDGKIDEVRVYNRALSVGEVQKLYEWAPGPVMHLKMDEMSGGTAFDSSGSGNDGTLVVAPSWVPGKYGSATQFTGVGENIKIDKSATLNNLRRFTYGAWVKADNCTDSQNPILEKGSGSTQRKTFYLGATGGGTPARAKAMMDTDATNAYSESVSSAYTVGTWEYWSVTYDDFGDRKIRLYKNGEEVSYTTQTAATGNLNDDSTSDFGIGSTPVSYFYKYNGIVDDVKIYNYIRTQKQILEDMNGGRPALNAPVLDLSFDEGFGDTAHDASGFGNDGTLTPGAGGTNTTVTAMWSKNGKNGGAMEFDGTDDYVDTGIAMQSLSYPFSISFWGKLNSTVNENIVLSYNDGNDDSFGVEWTNSTQMDITIFDPNSTNGSMLQTTVPAKDTNWHHFVFTVNSFIDYNFYMDEISYSLSSGSKIINPLGTTLRIGGRGSTKGWDGLIDEVKIYNYALTETEIKTLYNNSKATVMGEDASRNNNGSTVTGANKDYCIPGDTSQCDAPVLELKMDELSGGTAYDTSGNGNNGTISGATWNPLGKKGNAISFDGVDDYVSTPINPSTDFGNYFTISFWAYSRSGSSAYTSDGPALFGADSGGDNRFYLRHDNAYPATSLFIGISNWAVEQVNAIELNKWQYYSIVLDGTTGYFYRNGKLFSSQGSIVTNYPNNIIDIGNINDVSNDFVFNGLIDDVKIYNYARTPAQIAWDYNGGKPVVEWRFDECSGSTIHDESGNGNHGILNLGISGVVATGTCASSSNSFWYNGRDGKVNSAGSFDGVSDYVGDMRVPIRTSGKGEFSASLWFKTNSLSSGPMLMFGNNNGGSSEGDGQIGWRSGTGNLAASIYKTSGGHWPVNASASYRDGTWHHVFMVLDENSLRLYVDGLFVTQNSSVNSINAQTYSSDPYIIVGVRTMNTGSDIDDVSWFSGELDEIKVYNYALTAEQIKDKYNGGAVKFGE